MRILLLPMSPFGKFQLDHRHRLGLEGMIPLSEKGYQVICLIE